MLRHSGEQLSSSDNPYISALHRRYPHQSESFHPPIEGNLKRLKDARHLIKENFFAMPDSGQLPTFDETRHTVDGDILLDPHTNELRSEVLFTHHGQQRQLRATAGIRNAGIDPKAASLEIGPYGFSNEALSRFLLPHRDDLIRIRGNVFHSLRDFNTVLESAMGSQYAYALIIDMIGEVVKTSHEAGVPAILAGYSYGANVISAYTTRAEREGLDMPDGLILIEGGNIVHSTLQSPKIPQSDPETVRLLEEGRDLYLPPQDPIPPELAAKTLWVRNTRDKRVFGGDELFAAVPEDNILQIGTGKVTTHGGAPYAKALSIRQRVDSHIGALLAS